MVKLTETETETKMSEKDLTKLVRFTHRVHTEYITSRDMESLINTVKGKTEVNVDIR